MGRRSVIYKNDTENNLHYEEVVHHSRAAELQQAYRLTGRDRWSDLPGTIPQRIQHPLDAGGIIGSAAMIAIVMQHDRAINGFVVGLPCKMWEFLNWLASIHALSVVRRSDGSVSRVGARTWQKFQETLFRGRERSRQRYPCGH